MENEIVCKNCGAEGVLKYGADIVKEGEVRAMMEIEFIILTIALIVLSLLSVYCGVKFVIGFVAWKKLRAIRQKQIKP